MVLENELSDPNEDMLEVVKGIYLEARDMIYYNPEGKL
ncbi:hypothetical protein J2Y67_005269 [Neobacillus niacini]|nr:hypothetical protein [Neobacillus niacini]